MMNAMGAIIGRLPPKCADEDHGKVTRTAGVSGILKTATAIKTTANGSIIEVCFLIGRTKKQVEKRKKKRFAHAKIRESNRQMKITKEDQSFEPV